MNIGALLYLKSFIQYVCIYTVYSTIFFLLPREDQIFPISLPTQHHVLFLFYSLQKKNQNKRPTRQKITKAPLHTHTQKQKMPTQQKNVESILCWPPSPGHEDCPGLWLVHPLALHWRKLIVLSQQVKIAKHFLLRVGLCVCFSFSGVGSFLA